jgi:hypothetical protein
MAEIVQSLFGVTPEAYQQAQSQRGDAMALQYAKLDPFQQANYAIGRGAYGLAGAVGGLLGGQDPELQRITARQQIAKQINPNDPASIQQGIMALQQAGDTQGALMLQSEYQKMQESSALINQRQAASIASLAQAGRERTQATPEKIQLAQEIALQSGPKGSIEFNTAYAGALQQLIGSERTQPVPEKIQLAREEALMAGAPGTPEYQTAYQKAFKRFTTSAESNTEQMRNAMALASLKGAPGSPEYNSEFEAKLTQFTSKAEGKDATTTDITNARALAALAGPVGSPEYNAEFQSKLSQFTTKADAHEPTTSELTNARAVALRSGPAGSPEYNAAFDAEYKRLTAEKAPREPTTADLTNARAMAAQAGPIGSPEYNAAFNAEYKRLTAEKESKETKTEIQKLQEYAATLKRGSPEFAQVQSKIKALGESGGTKVEVKNIMPGDKNLADIPAFRASVQRTIEPQLKTITATDQALTAINDSLETGNFAAYRAAQVQFARAISGAGDMSQKELKAAGADPSLLGGTADYLSTVFSSTPTADTQKKIRSTLQAIQTVARRQAQGEVDQQMAMALSSPGYQAEAVKKAMNFPQLQGGAAPSAGGDLAAQAAAELARRKGGK